MLLFLKYLSSINSSRDRARFQKAKSRFDADEVTDTVFSTVRDSTFKLMKMAYWFLQYGAGVAFAAGCALTLIGVRCAL